MSKTNNVLLRNEINPKDTWDLTHLYANEDIYDQECKNAEAHIPIIASFRGTISESPLNLFKYLEDRDHWLLIIDRLYSYAFQHSDEDTSQTKAQAMKNSALNLYTRFASAIAWEAPELYL